MSALYSSDASYYDMVLITIPLLLASASVIGVLSSIPLVVMLVIAGVFAAVATAHALFVRPPVDPPSPPGAGV